MKFRTLVLASCFCFSSSALGEDHSCRDVMLKLNQKMAKHYRKYYVSRLVSKISTFPTRSIMKYGLNSEHPNLGLIADVPLFWLWGPVAAVARPVSKSMETSYRKAVRNNRRVPDIVDEIKNHPDWIGTSQFDLETKEMILPDILQLGMDSGQLCTEDKLYSPDEIVTVLNRQAIYNHVFARKEEQMLTSTDLGMKYLNKNLVSELLQRFEELSTDDQELFIRFANSKPRSKNRMKLRGAVLYQSNPNGPLKQSIISKLHEMASDE
jgi:hypothetical protein